MNPRYQKIRKRLARRKKKRLMNWRFLLVLFLLPLGGFLINRPPAANQTLSFQEDVESVGRESHSNKSSSTLSFNSMTESSSNKKPTPSIATASSKTSKTEPRTAVSSEERCEMKGTLFIGDSRTEGLALYTNLSDTTFYAQKGLTVKSIFTEPFIKDDQETITVLEALKKYRYSKIFIMLGVNELGWSYSDVFFEQYSKLVEQILDLQPNAQIYIQSILPVSKEKSESDPYINKNRINSYNQMLKQIAQKWQVTYLPVDDKLKDQNGYLPKEASVDGIHLNRTYCLKWLNAIEPILDN